MINNKSVTAIILVAGNSTRFGKKTNKNFETIHDKAILSYSIKAFNNNPYIDDIVVVHRDIDTEQVETIIKEEKPLKKIMTTIGGDTRQVSVYNGLQKTLSDIVIIHDGARPALKQSYIDNCLKEMQNFQGVTIGVKTKDTIKITDDFGIVLNTTKRANTWIIQTPQCFHRQKLLELHQKYPNDEATDDCMILEKERIPVKIIEGDYTNIKVTTAEDINIIQEFLK